jgi:adenylyl-sulfate kinase
MTAGGQGFTLWLTGLSGAGKSTLASAVEAALIARGRSVELLDAESVRHAFGDDLGHTPADRVRNMRRLGFLSRLLSRHGVAVIVAAMSPYRAVRDEIRASHQAPFVEVFVDCPLEELVRRDTKGLYSRAQAGTLANVIGVSEPYEVSDRPEVHLKTDRTPVAECVQAILSALQQRRLIDA